MIKKRFEYYLLILLLISFFSVSKESCSFNKDELIGSEKIIPSNPVYIVSSKDKVKLYESPKAECYGKNIFIISNDLLYNYNVKNDFSYIEYINKEGFSIYGWVKSSEIKPYQDSKLNMYPKELHINDFMVKNNIIWLGLNERFTAIKSKLSREVNLKFVGDFPNNNGGMDKYYSYTSDSIEMTVSNTGYSDRLWNVDEDGIILTIVLKNGEFKTSRNIKVGDHKDLLLEAYQDIKFIEELNKIVYNYSNMSLVFYISNDKVSKIELNRMPKEPPEA